MLLLLVLVLSCWKRQTTIGVLSYLIRETTDINLQEVVVPDKFDGVGVEVRPWF